MTRASWPGPARKPFVNPAACPGVAKATAVIALAIVAVALLVALGGCGAAP